MSVNKELWDIKGKLGYSKTLRLNNPSPLEE